MRRHMRSSWPATIGRWLVSIAKVGDGSNEGPGGGQLGVCSCRLFSCGGGRKNGSGHRRRRSRLRASKKGLKP
jgi:hypothetical protein